MKNKSIYRVLIPMIFVSLSACASLGRQDGYGAEKTLPVATPLEKSEGDNATLKEVKSLRQDIKDGFLSLKESLVGRQAADLHLHRAAGLDSELEPAGLAMLFDQVLDCDVACVRIRLLKRQ